MVEVREKQTDFRRVFREFFGISDEKNKEDSENEFEKWRKENISVISKTEGNINNLITKTFSSRTANKQKSLKNVKTKVNSNTRSITTKIKTREDNEQEK